MVPLDVSIRTGLKANKFGMFKAIPNMYKTRRKIFLDKFEGFVCLTHVRYLEKEDNVALYLK